MQESCRKIEGEVCTVQRVTSRSWERGSGGWRRHCMFLFPTVTWKFDRAVCYLAWNTVQARHHALHLLILGLGAAAAAPLKVRNVAAAQQQ